MDLASSQIVKVDIPAELRHLDTLGSVAWLSESTIALGFVNYGIAVLDLTTGTAKTLWRIEAGE